MMCLAEVRQDPGIIEAACTIDTTMVTDGQDKAAGPSSSYFGKRLIFFGAAENKTEPALLQLFSEHGEVAHIFIVRSALGISSGCGFVTFAAADQAKAALEALNGSTDCAEAGTTLGLLLVDEGPSSNSSSTGATASEADSSASGASTQQEKLGKSVFFTKVPPTVTQNQLIQLFTACGEVAHLELFIPWPGAKISRGCGLVEFTCSRAASAAVHSLHQQFTWPHSHSALVVEWVDRNRQSSNKASKVRAGAAGGAAVVGSARSLPGSTSLRADHQQAAAAAGFGWRSAQTGAGQVAFTGMASMPQAQLLQLQQQARSSRSCPLPQLPPGWQVVGTAQQLPGAARMAHPACRNAQWASVPSSLSSFAGSRQPQAVNIAGAAYLQQQSQLQHTDNNALTLQQQILQQQQQTQHMAVCSSDAGSEGTWMACPTTGGVSNTSMDLSSLASLGSVYDTTVLSGSTFSSAANSTHNSGVLHSQMGVAWDRHQQSKFMDLTSQDPSACSAASHTSPSVQYSEPMLAVSAAAAAAVAGNTSDPVLQQLLQQNVMLFQTMTPPPEEEVVGQQYMLSSSGAQQQGLQATGVMATTSSAINSGLVTGLPTYLPISQAQQMNSGAGAVYTGSALHGAQQPMQQQLWYMQQGQHTQQQTMQQQTVQQQQGESPSLVVLPLSDRQLAAMSAVLPEVPKLTGAQAWISSAAAGGLQLCLSGTYTQLQAGHTAVAMLLGRSGIDEPLAPAVVHAAAS